MKCKCTMNQHALYMIAADISMYICYERVVTFSQVNRQNSALGNNTILNDTHNKYHKVLTRISQYIFTKLDFQKSQKLSLMFPLFRPGNTEDLMQKETSWVRKGEDGRHGKQEE